MTYEQYSTQVLGKKLETPKGKRQYRRIPDPVQNVITLSQVVKDPRLPLDSKDAVRLLNDAVATITSAKITEELAKADYRDSKKVVLEALEEKISITKEELVAVVKVAEAKAKDKVLDLDNGASAILKVLDLDTNSLEVEDEVNV